MTKAAMKRTGRLTHGHRPKGRGPIRDALHHVVGCGRMTANSDQVAARRCARAN